LKKNLKELEKSLDQKYNSTNMVRQIKNSQKRSNGASIDKNKFDLISENQRINFTHSFFNSNIKYSN